MSEAKETTEAADTARRVEVLVRWLPGWYASRLHAVKNGIELPTGMATIRSLCGAFVYGKAPTDWAQRRMDKGIPNCRHCEKLTPNALLCRAGPER